MASKLKKELKEEDGTVLLPVESVPEVSMTTVKKTVKRQLSEKQQENAKRLGEASKARWEKLREEKARIRAEEEEKKKEEEKALIDAGTHIRVKLKPKRMSVIREKPTTPMAPLPKSNPVLRREKAYEISDTDDTSETEDTDVEERPQRVRRQIRKNVKALEQVEAVLQTVQNPYLSVLAGRWR